MIVEDGYMPLGLISVPTKIATLPRVVEVTAEAGTNGYQGGDAGKGCRTYFRVQTNEANSISITTFAEGAESIATCCDGFEFVIGGDGELDATIETLEFITVTLREQREQSNVANT